MIAYTTGRWLFPLVGKVVRQVYINHTLIVKATQLDSTLPVMNGMERLITPFASSITLLDPLPLNVEASVWVSSSEESGRAEGVTTIHPQAFAQRALGEVQGSFPIVVQLSGAWTSYFADKDIGKTSGTKISQGAGASDCRWLCRHGGQQPSIYAQSCGLDGGIHCQHSSYNHSASRDEAHRYINRAKL